MTAYTPYDLLRTLVERVGWPDEREKRVALESVAEWERVAIFGNLVKMMECDHPELAPDGRCAECGKIIEYRTAGHRRLRRGVSNVYEWGA